MVALDDRPRDAERLNDVGVDGALTEPLDVLELVRLLIEDLDEAAADDLALLLGVGDALQGAEELVPSIDADDVQPQVLVVAQHALELALA